MFICVAPRGAGTVAAPSGNSLAWEFEDVDELLDCLLISPLGVPLGDAPPGLTGFARVGRENEADLEEELDEFEGRLAFVAVFAARDGEGRLWLGRDIGQVGVVWVDRFYSPITSWAFR